MSVDLTGSSGRVLERLNNVVCKKYAAEAEQWAKANAPWEDRTGNARRLIKGRALEPSADGALGFKLMHRVEYGKYLETAHSGKYAILKPTIESLRQGFFGLCNEVIKTGKGE